MLQCVAMCCSVLPWATGLYSPVHDYVWCSVLQCVACDVAACIAVQCDVVCCSVLQCIVVCCTALQCVSV